MKPHFAAHLMTRKPSRTHKRASVSGRIYADVEGAAWELLLSGRPDVVGVIVRLVRGKDIEPITVQVLTRHEDLRR